MATTKQKEAARKNLEKARAARSGHRRPAEGGQRRSRDLDTADKNRLSSQDFAFPKERKEPLVDASHVRNAIARFDQVEGVSDDERDQAWERIRRAAKRYGVEVEADGWRELFKGGKSKKH
ncbi:MAG TPA: DUF6582 domain-containing protein [Acidimicrobiales bacterium]|jgi:hypothetical protein